ncbi:MAG: hypothetical protein ACK5QC_08395 [Bacteroidota bacterium]|jgi:hypothetical protein
MKRLFFKAAFIFIANSVFAENQISDLLAVPTKTHVIKSNGGLFGYRIVTVGHDNDGDLELGCSRPGFKSCKYSPTDITNPGPLTTDELLDIDRLVKSNVSESNRSGEFNYGNFLVKYRYDVNIDETKYNIYTAEEVANGISNEEL